MNQIIKFLTFTLILILLQFSNVFAQNTVGFAEVKKLHDEQKYTAVLSAIDPLIDRYVFNYKDDKDFAETLSSLYYLRGSSRFNAIYQARTGMIFGSGKVFDENRPRFELTYEDKFIKVLDGATTDLKQAYEIGFGNLIVKKDDSGFAYRFQSTEFSIRKIEALIYLEKAQFVTNSNADFVATQRAFATLEPLYTIYLGIGAGFIEDFTRFKDGEILAAELRYKIALGQIDDANLLLNKWNKANGYSSLKKEIAVASMVEAFDMVGNYKHSEAFLIREAIRQITIDKGKVIPENFTLLKTAMKSHLANLNFAIRTAPTDKLLSFQRARLASAYNVKGNLTPAESAFVKNAPDVIKTDKNSPPLDVQLLSVMLKLQSTDKKEKDAAKKMLEEILKKDGTNAAILAVSGYAKMLSNDFKGAETDLSAAIKKDAFLAFAYKALENRSASYKKLGKADLAAKDEKENAQFQQLLAFLAAA
jgi:hypothetical protein